MQFRILRSDYHIYWHHFCSAAFDQPTITTVFNLQTAADL